MTLDASGNLLVGTTSASYSVSGRGLIEVNGSSESLIAFKIGGSTTNAVYQYNTASNFETNVTGSRPCLWNVGGAERVRIDSSGNLLVGTTSGSTHTLLKSADSTPSLIARNGLSSGTLFGITSNFSAAAPNNSTSFFLQCNDTGAERCTIRSNGGIANYQANDVNLSDSREKINFAPAKSYLETICAIPVQTFNYIDQNMEEDGGLTLGVVAQDVQAVAPELVTESNWGSKEDPKMRLSIYQTDFQYALMKSIQELNANLVAQVAALSQRLAALESN
jgi:hypothetical protein